MPWALVCVLAVALASIVFLYFREKSPPPATLVRFQIPVPENASLLFNLSPDGRSLAFIAGDRLWVHSLEPGESHDLTASDSHIPFWSPDSRFVGYLFQGKLKKIEVAGGPPQTVADLHANVWGGGTWNQHDFIIFSVGRALFRVPASGGVPVPITALDPARQETGHAGPSFLPDGRNFVYARWSTDEEKSAVYLGSVDAKPEQQNRKPLVASNWQPAYAASVDPNTGYLLFVREGALMAQTFDNLRLALKGQATPVAEHLNDNGGGTGGYAAFTASANGVLAFQRSAAPQLTWYDREGTALRSVGEPSDYQGLALSPDGMRLAVTKLKGANAVTASIWLLDLARGGASTRFTFGSARARNPVWSADGSRIIFSSDRDGPWNLYQKSANGATDEEALLKSGEEKYPTSWSRDGRFLLYTVVHPKTKSDIWVLPLEGYGKPVPFLITEFSEHWARFSPDGHWVAYTSDESGHDEIYVRSFSMNSAQTAVEVGAKWPISSGFGTDSRWRADGRELYYRSRSGGLLAVDIATNPAFRAGNPRPLGGSTFAGQTLYGWLWDSSADGRRFLRLATQSGPQSYSVVLNWQTGLKK